MLSDLVNEEGYIYVEAHPEYYDSMESLAINTKTHEFEICDGGGQRICTVYRGKADYTHQGTLILHYKHEDISERDMDHTITFKYSITSSKTKHFNGYGLHVSNHHVKFDRSLLTPPDQPIHERDPLVFYTIDRTEDCDTQLYRAKHRIERDKDVEIPPEFAEYHNTDLSDEILSKIVDIRRDFMNGTMLEYTTVLGASKDGLFLYYTDREYFMFLSPLHFKIYLEDHVRDIHLEPKMVHTFEYAQTEDKDMIESVVNIYKEGEERDAKSGDVKAFVEEITGLF